MGEGVFETEFDPDEDDEVRALSPVELREFHAERWAGLVEARPDLAEAAVVFLRGYLPEETKADIRRAVAEDAFTWWVGYHFTFGMNVRNALRVQANIPDMGLPSLNWDDYWAEAVEHALEPAGEVGGGS